jgi:peptidoglycan/xylan/chitin deacetylase (PgdA/CDA1 family)
MKKAFATLVGRACLRSGLLGFLDRRADTLSLARNGGTGPRLRWRKTVLTILVYHRVNDERDPFFPATPVDVFAGQMAYLASRFNVCRLDDALEGLRAGRLPGRALVITFDDGYRDNYLNAFPVLARLGLPATILLATGVIGSDRVLWHDRVFAAFRETRREALEGFVPDGGRLPLGTLAERLAAQREVLRHLWRVPDDRRTAEIDRLVERLGTADRTSIPGLMLSWDEVRVMHAGGIGFGAHTVSHPVLSMVPRARAVEEIRHSKETIECVLGAPVRAFAYPVGRRGDFTDETKQFLRETGYACALSTLPGVNGSEQDPFELRRLSPWDDDLARFGARLTLDRMFG